MPDFREVLVDAEEPRTRGEIIGLCGKLKCSIKVLNTLHVGSIQTLTGIDEDKLREIQKELQEKQISWEQAVEKVLKLGIRAENPFFKISDIIAIPASTVKGNIRARLELSFRPRNGKIRSCFFTKGEGQVDSWKHRRHMKIWNDGIKDRRFVIVSREKQEKQEGQCVFEKVGKVCLLCDLFGTTGLMGLVFFSDFIGEASPQIIELPIGRKFIRMEVAPQGSVFRGEICFFNLSSPEIGLLLLGMGIEKTREGRRVLMGRFKYSKREYGRVMYQLDGFKLSSLSIPLEVEEMTVEPGEEITNHDELNKLVILLTNAAKKEFPDLEIVDEVKKLEGG